MTRSPSPFSSNSFAHQRPGPIGRRTRRQVILVDGLGNHCRQLRCQVGGVDTGSIGMGDDAALTAPVATLSSTQLVNV